MGIVLVILLVGIVVVGGGHTVSGMGADIGKITGRHDSAPAYEPMPEQPQTQGTLRRMQD